MDRLHLRPRQVTPTEAKSLGLKTAARLRVIDPMTERPLPNAGHRVVPSSYWVKRLRDGDVEPVQPASSPRAKLRTGASKES